MDKECVTLTDNQSIFYLIKFVGLIQLNSTPSKDILISFIKYSEDTYFSNDACRHGEVNNAK